jgi:DNA excision repair protein ERCC-4
MFLHIAIALLGWIKLCGTFFLKLWIESKQKMSDLIKTKEAIEINLFLLLKYQENIVVDLVEQDALLVLGKGLGTTQIVSNLLHVLNQSTGGKKKSLIMLINASDDENRMIEENLMELSWGTNTDEEKILESSVADKDDNICKFSSIKGDAGTVDRRRQLYANGGIVSISNRVLVTDLLSHVLEPSVITGLVILHAENISQYSMDRFVVNLYRKENKWGFVKAISADPEKCCKGFQPLQTKLKYFKLDKSFLWPRFHVGITESIQRKFKHKQKEQSSNKVTEVRIKMTNYMEKIQNSLMASIEILIGELKRNNPDLASEYWSIENALDDNFVQSIIGSMNPVWHRISITTKKLLSELSTLKVFLIDLYKLDAVTYYHNIRSFVNDHTVSMSNKESLWLMLPEASATITCAKDRVYSKSRSVESKSVLPRDNYLLEELPKWEQLMLILDEINDEKLTKDATDDGPIVIACMNRQTCFQLKRILERYRINDENNVKSYNFRKIMLEELKYQQWRKTSGFLVRKMNEELKKVKEQDTEKFKEDDVIISKTFTRNNPRSSDRRRKRGGSVVAQHNRLMNLRPEEDEEDEEDSADADYQDQDNDIIEIGYSNQEPVDDADFEDFLESMDEEKSTFDFEFPERSDEIMITTFETIDLEEILPSYIICYEPDLTFIRMVELYQASLFSAKCFFLYYGESVEEQIYLNSIKHEKDAFTKLIREKANMPKYFSTDDDEKAKFDESFRHLNSKTRIAGGGNLKAVNTNKIIVDMRDFNSQLPFVCHLAGLEVIPAMLTVGDYILSNDICVERKAVRDLIDSLENGRLMNQCESMFKWYEKPVLLIEFEEGKSFSFEPFTTGFLTNNSTKHVKNNELEQLQLRLAALIRSYPRLSILWSSSPFETARLFKELKSNQHEPDIEYALTAGTNGIATGTGYNEDALKILKLIPGINDANSLLIVNKVKSLYEFSQMSQDEISEIIGKECGQLAFQFLNRRYK